MLELRLVYRTHPQDSCQPRNLRSDMRDAGFCSLNSGLALGRCLLALLASALPGLAQAPRTPPSIVTASALPAALAGSPYSQTLAATGSTPITWRVTSGSLSAGLTLNK